MSKKVDITNLLNDLTFFTIYNHLKNLALNMFVWEGLPEGMRPEYIENTLYEYGTALFFKDPNVNFLCLHGAGTGGVNVYNEFNKYTAFGGNGYQRTMGAADCVRIYNNPIRVNTRDYIMLYTNKLVEIERTIDVNVKAQKTPRIILCDDKDRLTFLNIFSQVDGNKPAVYADKNLNMNSFDVLDVQAPYVCDKLTDLRHDIYNEILTILSINNANTDKRERLVTDEVNANNDLLGFNAALMLESRQKACEEIKEAYGLDISVSLRRVDNGEVHNDDKGDSGSGD